MEKKKEEVVMNHQTSPEEIGFGRSREEDESAWILGRDLGVWSWNESKGLMERWMKGGSQRRRVAERNEGEAMGKEKVWTFFIHTLIKYYNYIGTILHFPFYCFLFRYIPQNTCNFL